MLRVVFVRGKFLNNFEGQNYIFPKNFGVELTGISSLNPINDNFPFPVIKLPSVTDFADNRTAKIICNRILGDPQILFGLEKYAGRFDIFHTADPHYYYSYQLAKLRAKNLIKKLIVTSWETIPFNNETVWRKKINKYFVLKHADNFICYTEKAKRCLIDEGAQPEKIELMRLGVDLASFKMSASRGESKIKDKFKNNKNITILFVGRLVLEKGVMDLYDAFRRLIKKTITLRVPKYKISFNSMSNIYEKSLLSQPQVTRRVINLRLRIVGDGELKQKLRKKIKKDGLDRFVTIEQHRYEEMPKVYQSADIFVLPSKTTKTWEEQYGMVLVEAMASGLPIVAYDSGAIGEIVGKTGILIREGNINDLARTIERLTLDSRMRVKLGKMGRRRAEEYFDAKKTTQQIKIFYENNRNNSD